MNRLMDYRAHAAQTALLLAKPFLLILAFAIFARIGGWLWLVSLVLIPFLSSTMSVVMHDVGHGLLRGQVRHFALFILGSMQMLSGHAFWASHAQHHRRYPADAGEDPEGAPTTKSFVGMLKMIPTFAPRLWLWAWRSKPAIRCWLVAEVVLSTSMLIAGFVLWLAYSFPLLLAYCLSTLGTSWVGYTMVAWLSHQPKLLMEPRKQALSGTLFGSIAAFFFSVIVFHDEHHAQDAVPSCNLARFARDSQKS